MKYFAGHKRKIENYLIHRIIEEGKKRRVKGVREE